MNIQSLSPPCMLMEFCSLKNISGASQWNNSRIFLNNSSSWRLAAPCSSFNPSLKKPWDLKLIWKDDIYTICATPQACAQTSDGVPTNTFSLAATVKISAKKKTFKQPLLNVLDLLAWIMWDKLYEAILFEVLATHQLLLLLSRMLQTCFSVKLQKRFVDYETSPDFPSVWREEMVTLILGKCVTLTTLVHDVKIIDVLIKFSVFQWLSK